MRCVDLDCGGEEVTLELARIVASAGEVVGVDMDEVKLDLARQAAVERGFTNVSFQVRNVNDWDEPDAHASRSQGLSSSICHSRSIYCAACAPLFAPATCC